jgi:hypothetical protein
MVHFLTKVRVPLLIVFSTVAGLRVLAQAPDSERSLPVPALSASATTSCNPWVLQTLPVELSFRQRFCLELAHLSSPAAFLRASAAAGWGQWRNNAPSIKPRDGDDYSTRLGYSYERRSARAASELFVGYLHHEDPRPRRSNLQGVWKRSHWAVMSVLISPGEDGHARVALLPIAGSLSSGLVSMAVYPHENSWSDGFDRAGIAYGLYFARALVHEFSPELWSLTPRFVRKHRESWTKAATL